MGNAASMPTEKQTENPNANRWIDHKAIASRHAEKGRPKKAPNENPNQKPGATLVRQVPVGAVSVQTPKERQRPADIFRHTGPAANQLRASRHSTAKQHLNHSFVLTAPTVFPHPSNRQPPSFPPPCRLPGRAQKPLSLGQKRVFRGLCRPATLRILLSMEPSLPSPSLPFLFTHPLN